MQIIVDSLFHLHSRFTITFYQCRDQEEKKSTKENNVSEEENSLKGDNPRLSARDVTDADMKDARQTQLLLLLIRYADIVFFVTFLNKKGEFLVEFKLKIISLKVRSH